MKSLKKNYAYNLIYQITTIISPLITAPYISRVLGPDNIGKYSYTQSIVAYIIVLMTLGTTIYAQREIAFYQNDRIKQTKIFIELVIIKIGLGICGLSALLFLIIFYEQYRTLFIIQSIELLASIICIDWLYTGNEEFKTTMLRGLGVKVFDIFCIFLFVRTKDDLYKYVFVMVMGIFLGNASLWVGVKRLLSNIELKNLSFKPHIIGSMSVFVAQIAASIYSMLDKIMIGLITNSDFENGYYEQAQKIIRILLTFISAFGTVVIPRISNAHFEKNKSSVEQSIFVSFNYMWLIALPMAFGLVATAPSFVPWFYGPGYEKVIVLIQILAILSISIGINNITGAQYLLATNRERTLTVTEIVGAVVNIILNIILISKMASVGAAIASVAAETTVAITQMIFIKKEINIKKMLLLSWKYLVSSMVMFIIVLLLRIFLFNKATVVNSMVLVAVGGIVYFAMLVCLRDKYFIDGIKNMIGNRIEK